MFLFMQMINLHWDPNGVKIFITAKKTGYKAEDRVDKNPFDRKVQKSPKQDDIDVIATKQIEKSNPSDDNSSV